MFEQSNIFEGLSSSLEGLHHENVDFMLNNPASSTFLSEEEAATDQEQLNSGATNLENSTLLKAKSKRKRGRASKTREEVERQRMTHIAVERNRRMQMNHHLQILRSLMPNSYVQRGDQASIVGGAIEFVRELEDLLQCLESVKMHVDPVHREALISPAGLDDLMDQRAESKSMLADVKVNLSGIFGLIKILSRRKEGQVIKNIAAVENLQLQILQTNITTIQEDVVCSFSVMMSAEAEFRAEDIANSVQQKLLSFNNMY